MPGIVSCQAASNCRAGRTGHSGTVRRVSRAASSAAAVAAVVGGLNAIAMGGRTDRYAPDSPTTAGSRVGNGDCSVLFLAVLAKPATSAVFSVVSTAT